MVVALDDVFALTCADVPNSPYRVQNALQIPSQVEVRVQVGASTDPGFNCNPTVKERIEKLAVNIEALTPTDAPTGQMEAVEGRWRLLYSSFGLEQETTLERLAFGKLPNVPVSVTGIFQEIYTDNQQYNNLIEFALGSGINGVTKVVGRYRVENSQRLNIDFLEASAFSATDDLNPSAFCNALGVNRDSLKSFLSFSGWSDITYLDETLRLMRGNHQNLYVLVRIG